MSNRRGRRHGSVSEGDVTPSLGKTIMRLRKAYNLSLGELSEQSGVAKSIISQIERNETNPTISTVWRLSRALDTTIDEVLKDEAAPNFIEHQQKAGVPILESQDGLCRLAIVGALSLVEYLQWYDFEAKPGGVLESDPHPPGTVEHLYLIAGELTVTVAGEARVLRTGESLRYHGDRAHKIVNTGTATAHATMVLVVHGPQLDERRQ
ncbi:MAG TPA: XRE family transcriptional regulator [Aestuariivirgaceae bacterium]|nr:XRE family transcriptional regulator [Aestuariivirgaceae bacterium]